jgi:hypothetical protein
MHAYGRCGPCATPYHPPSHPPRPFHTPPIFAGPRHCAERRRNIHVHSIRGHYVGHGEPVQPPGRRTTHGSLPILRTRGHGRGWGAVLPPPLPPYPMHTTIHPLSNGWGPLAVVYCLLVLLAPSAIPPYPHQLFHQSMSTRVAERSLAFRRAVAHVQGCVVAHL